MGFGMWEACGQCPLISLCRQFCSENRWLCLAFQLKALTGILFFLLVSEGNADGHLPFMVTEQNLPWSHVVSDCRSGRNVLAFRPFFSWPFHLKKKCTFPSRFIPEKPSRATQLFIEKNLPYLLAQVAWSLLSCCPVEVGTRYSAFDDNATGLSCSLFFRVSVGRGLLAFPLYSEQTFGKLVLSSEHLK